MPAATAPNTTALTVGSSGPLPAALLDCSALPTLPAVAVQVVAAASRPDCEPGEIVSLLAQDPVLCARLLGAVNSCLFGLSRPVSSVPRAVTVLGLNTVRSLTLGLALPAATAGPRADAATREYWVTAVSTGIFARELAGRVRGLVPEDDLVAGLLQDLGALVLRRSDPGAWGRVAAAPGARHLARPCEVERGAFGTDHAEVSAQLLTGWGLPVEIVEPVRFHHRPGEFTDGTRAMADRAALLNFAGRLAQIDAVAQHPELLAEVLGTAEARYGMGRGQLVGFLEAAVPKVKAFTALMNQPATQCPDYAAVLGRGTEELVRLTVGANLARTGGGSRPAEPPPSATTAPALGNAMGAPGTESPVPEFRLEHLDRLPAGGSRLGGFELRGELGRGAMGVVFRAHEPSLDRPVAVKFLSPALGSLSVYRQRFLREARVSAGIRHENVVAVYAVGEAAGLPYLAMEYVAGACLDTVLGRKGPLPVPLVLSVAGQLAAGLGAAHARGVIHRDVKPANVLLETGTERAKLMDFGLASSVDNLNLTGTGALIGTPYYMAPEVVEGAPATAASDLFSLGGLLYALTAGRPPFEGRTVPAVFRAVTACEPLPLGRLRPECPGWFADLVARLLHRDPGGRPASAGEVAATVSRHHRVP